MSAVHKAVWLRGVKKTLKCRNTLPAPQGASNSAGEMSCATNTPGQSRKRDKRVGRGLEGEEFTVRDHSGLGACYKEGFKRWDAS